MNPLLWILYIKLLSLKYVAVQLTKVKDEPCSNMFTFSTQQILQTTFFWKLSSVKSTSQSLVRQTPTESHWVWGS